MRAPEFIERTITNVREHTGNALAAGGIAVGSILGIGAVEVAVDATHAIDASAWTVGTGAEVDCITGPGTGEAVAHVTFLDKESVDSGKDMNVTLSVAGRTINFGTVAAGTSETKDVDLGPAPTESTEGLFSESWVDQKKFGHGTDTKPVEIPAETDVCPTPTSTSTSESTSTTSTTAAETTSTSESTSTTSTTAAETTSTSESTSTTSTTSTTTPEQVEGSTTSTIKAATTSTTIATPSQLPKTGDSSKGFAELATGALAAGGALWLGAKKRKAAELASNS